MQTLERMWEANQDFVARLLARLTRNADLADDLMQETYLRARGGITQYRGGNPRAWLAAIARSAFYAHIRRQSSRRELPLDDDAARELTASPTDAQHLLTKLELHAEISRLTPPLRTALVMKYYGGLTYPEIARHLNCAVGTAKWRVSAAVRKLQMAFGVAREEVMTVAAKSLRDDVLDQLALRPLRFSLSEGSCGRNLKSALQIVVTEVLGSSPTIVDGSNYLVCGTYRLTEPVVDYMVLAATGKTTGYEAFLSPGEAPFELYGHVIQVTPTSPAWERMLTVRVFPDGANCSVLAITFEGWA